MINRNISYLSLFSSPEDRLNRKHPLYRLGNKIDRQRFNDAFSPLYSSAMGRPAKPIRLMCVLLILKHLRNLSDESVVELWSENVYYRYFCGMEEFTISFPCNATLAHFRKRTGEKGQELIPAESIRVNENCDSGDHHDTAFMDSTGREKNVTFPTDAKLYKKTVRKVLSTVKDLNLPLRRSYTFTLKRIYRDGRFRNHPRNRAKALKADKRLRTIAGRPVGELQRDLGASHDYDSLPAFYTKVLSQERNSPNKIYSLHEPEVQCISKGLGHKKYKFGNRVSGIRSSSGIIPGAKSFRNEYNGHTIEEKLYRVERITGRKIKRPAGDRGYKGKKEINGTEQSYRICPKTKTVIIREERSINFSANARGSNRQSDISRLITVWGATFTGELFGDSVNILLATAAYNFKRVMRFLLCLIQKTSRILFADYIYFLRVD